MTSAAIGRRGVVGLIERGVDWVDEILRFTRCPTCYADLARESGGVACDKGHSFLVVGGVPQLLNSGGEIAETFGAQWKRYEYDRDHAWNETLDYRIDELLGQLDLADGSALAGTSMVDAGCGTGEVAYEVAVRFRAKVFATDVSGSVFRAHQAFGQHVAFFQSDISHSPLRPGSFDLVHAGGVLHHTPSTRHALNELAGAVRPGGLMFVWLYHKQPGMTYRAKTSLRRMVAPLPSKVQQPIVTVAARASWLQHGGRTNWRDHRLIQHDFWTPRYRWEHNPDEVIGWFSALGFTAKQTSENRNGFGILGRRG